MRIVSRFLHTGIGVMALSFTLSTNLFAQVAHVAACKPASGPARSNNPSLMGKVVANLGDATAIASLKAIRYTMVVATGMGTNQVNIEMTLARFYPDRFVLSTRARGQAESRIEVSPTGAFVQVSGGPKTNLSEAMRDELLKTVRLDAFYVGQNVGSIKVAVTETGTERIGDVEAAALRLNVEGAEATWYVGREDGKLLRTVSKVPVMGGMVDQVADYLDWRSCDGLMVPFQRIITQGGKASQEKVLTVELNPSITVLPPTDSVTAADGGQTSSLPVGRVEVQPNPFGLEKGMTRAQIIDRIGQKSIMKEKDVLLTLSTAPMPHPAFESYTVAISPDKGLLKVSASGLTISVNDEGDQLKEQFESIYDGLVAKYGRGKRIDFVRGGDVNKESQFWMMTLLQGERTLEAFWNYEDKSGGDTRTGIALQAKALSIDKGYITLSYEFPGWNAYVDSHKAKQDSVF